MTRIKNVLAKLKNEFLNKIHKYVAGTDSLPDIGNADAKKYKAEFSEKAKKLKKENLVLYRGFSWPEDLREQDSFYIEPQDVFGAYTLDEKNLLSFTEDRQTAIAIAKERSDDEDNPFTFAIKVTCPLDRVWWHWKLDPKGLDHPKEKEVIIQPTGLKYEVVEAFQSKEEVG